jgi:hypothetical protein
MESVESANDKFTSAFISAGKDVDGGRQVGIVRLTGRFLLSVGMTRAGLGGCFSFLIFLKLLKLP